MSDLYHPDFVDRLCAESENHPDENDPYWVEFWRLKRTEEANGRTDS